MKRYEVIVLSKVRKKVDKLPMFIKTKVLLVLKTKLKDFDIALKTLDIKKLKWFENRYRLRIWKYRVLFEKYEDKLIILVIDIGSRWDVYK